MVINHYHWSRKRRINHCPVFQTTTSFEIVLIDINRKRWKRGMDTSTSHNLFPSLQAMPAIPDIVIITRYRKKPGQTRIELTQTNVGITKRHFRL